MAPEQRFLVQLERELAMDESGAKLAVLRRRLAAGRDRCREALDAGVPLSEAGALSRLAIAYGTALELVPELWKTQPRSG
jgi:hypothetical protein